MYLYTSFYFFIKTSLIATFVTFIITLKQSLILSVVTILYNIIRWKFKHPGRVGDSPLVGSGLYCDGQAAAVATGDGEEVSKYTKYVILSHFISCSFISLHFILFFSVLFFFVLFYFVLLLTSIMQFSIIPKHSS